MYVRGFHRFFYFSHCIEYVINCLRKSVSKLVRQESTGYVTEDYMKAFVNKIQHPLQMSKVWVYFRCTSYNPLPSRQKRTKKKTQPQINQFHRQNNQSAQHVTHSCEDKRFSSPYLSCKVTECCILPNKTAKIWVWY